MVKVSDGASILLFQIVFHPEREPAGFIEVNDQIGRGIRNCAAISDQEGGDFPAALLVKTAVARFALGVSIVA